MTSEQRREGRYQRRQAKRAARRMGRSLQVGGVEDVFTYHDLFRDGKKCCNGVRWKNSTQRFEAKLFSGTAVRCRAVRTGTWKPKNYVRFHIHERGKARTIDAPHITDRQVHKTLSRKVLKPLYTPGMIYDNGASMEGRGLHFSFRRLKQHLRWHWRRYGTEGYIVLIDLKNFFPSAPHQAILNRHRKLIGDPDLRKLADDIIHSVPGDRGMPLGVEPSQLEMVALPSAVDNYIKCQLGCHCAAHYMDDYYMIYPERAEAEAAMEAVCRKFESMGMMVNRAKSTIRPLGKPFRFCKAKFQLTDTGRVICHGCRDGMKRSRRKLRLFQREVKEGAKTKEQVRQWLNTALAYYHNYNDHGRELKLTRMYYAMFEKEAA